MNDKERQDKLLRMMENEQNQNRRKKVISDPTTSTKAIISLVTGVMCIPVVSIILGHVARGEIRKSKGSLTGAGMALAGLILGYLQLAVCLILLVSSLVLGGLAASNLGEVFEGSQEDTARSWVNGTGKQYVELYYLKSREYPRSLDDLLQPVVGTPLITEPESILDPWGNEYQYSYPGRENPNGFDLWTTTPDGRVIGNWVEY